MTSATETARARWHLDAIDEAALAERSLTELAIAFVDHEVSALELTDAFYASTLYCPRNASVGFVAFGEPGEGYVPMFSSELRLASILGAECPWFAGRGADLVDMLPAGYGVVLDLGSDGEVVLPAEALRRLRPEDRER